jgi:hypothetical protein
MSRIDNFRAKEAHPALRKAFYKLTMKEKTLCEVFILENSQLSDCDYELRINRWFLDKEKPKNWILMSELVK